MDTNVKIAVIGAGAIGGITAAYLTKAGFDVELVCKHRETAVIAGTEGLTIQGVRGEQKIRVKAVADIEELTGQKDIVLIVVKAYDMPDAARRILPHLKPDSLVVSMQNGICTDFLAEIVGADRTVGCVVGWGATMRSHAVLVLTAEGEFIIGSILPGMGDRLEMLGQLLSSVMPTKISRDIVSDLYSKMIINSCITSMGVMSGLGLGAMLKARNARNIFLTIISEAVAVANAMGLKIPPYAGKLDYYALVAGKGPVASFRKHLIIRIVGFKYRRLKSSSLQSLLRGKPTEVDFFNGYIARKGAEYGIKTPVNDVIVSIVKEIESGVRKPDPANFTVFE